MKSLLLYADNDHGWTARYTAALALARAFSSHLHCVQSTPFADSGDSFFGYPYPEIARELHEVGRQHRARVEEQLRGQAARWDWLEAVGPQAQMLIMRSGLADMTIVSSGGKHESGPDLNELALAGTVAIHARGPILAVPADLPAFDPLGTVLVAWNGSPEAANALRSSLPMLTGARKILLVSVGEDANDARNFTIDEAAGYLAHHGLQSEDHPWDRNERSVADALIDAAAILRADYILAGAYGHTRLREAVLGGTTRALLRDSPLPLVMAH